MEITLKELLAGNATIIKKKEYLSAQDYVMPFIDKMAKYTENFTVQVKLADQISVSDGKDLVYNRVLVQAVLPEQHCIDRHDEVVGFLYGLDVRKPIAKLYRGYLNRACTNLTVFNPEWQICQEIEPEKTLNYGITELLERTSDFKLKLDKMKSDFIPNERRLENLGNWVDFSLHQYHHNGIHSTKISHTTVIDAYKSVYLDDESDYYVSQDEESSVFNLYNAFTQVLTDDKRDITNKFEKTILINQMLGI